MKPGFKVTHFLLTLCLLLLAVPVVTGILLRMHAVQQRISDSFATAMGMEVRFEEFHPGLVSGLRMSRLTATNKRGDSLAVREVFAKLKVLPLLTGHLVFSEVALDGVRLVKMDQPEKSDNAGTPVVPAFGTDPARGSSDLRRLKLLHAVRSVKISDAALDWMLVDGRAKLQLEGVNLLFSKDDSGAGEGELRVDRGSWMEVVQFRDLQSAVTLASEKLKLSGIQARCGGGVLGGGAELVLSEGRTFAMDLAATGVDLGAMSEELPRLKLAGRAQGGLKLQGALADLSSWTGGGQVAILDGKFKELSLLQALGQVFQIQELTNLKVKEAKMQFNVSEAKVQFQELSLVGGDIVLVAPGTMDFNRNLLLNAKLTVPERLLTGRVSQMLGRGFSPVDEAGLRSIAFQVTGTLDKPSTDVVEKVVGDGLGGVVGQLLGGFLKSRKTDRQEAKNLGSEPQK